jgi:hypothetical protein
MPKKNILPLGTTKFPPIQITEAELFILESLRLEDEQAGRFEGKIMADILTLCGRKPIYYYFRTPEELVEFAGEFRKKGYRFLHLSCHGFPGGIETTLGKISSERFANIFAGILKNRRLFISACSVGKGFLPKLVGETNKGMYSILCPVDKIQFNHAAAIWAAFYTRMFDFPVAQITDKPSFKNAQIRKSLESLCLLFDVRFMWSYHDSKNDKWVHDTIPSSKTSNPHRQTKRNDQPVLK